MLETVRGDQIVIPTDYCGISFHDWLKIFLEYALTLARGGHTLSSYEVIAAAFHANVFYHSQESLFLVHVCWFSVYTSKFCHMKIWRLMGIQHVLYLETTT